MMILETTLLAALAGAAAFIGALIAYINDERIMFISARVRYGIIAFGGGALIGAVGLVLVPDGLSHQPLWLATVSFLVGGAVFMWFSAWLKARGTPVTQLIALMLDFIPEAIVLGAVITMNFAQAVFLSVIIAAQNLPEGFNAYREIRMSHESFLRKHVLWFMAGCIVVGIAAALIGLLGFEMDSALLGTIMTFCAGGILYLVFQDIIPEATDNDCGIYPAYGGILGFTVGLIGFGLVGH